jgi:uncharacterized surface protein with fasciclin (FAS1) repeats
MSGGMTVDELMKPENKQQLTQILQNHIIQGRHTSDQISQMSTLSPLSGQSIRVTKSDGQVMLDNTTRITRPDIRVGNGIVQVVDHVLAPAGTTERGAIDKAKSKSDIGTRGLDQSKGASGSDSESQKF